MCRLWDFQTTPYRPQANSVTGRINRTVGASLQALLIGKHHKDWDLQLPQIMSTLTATPHTISGETANYLMMG